MKKYFMNINSLKKQNHSLANSQNQLLELEKGIVNQNLARFVQKLDKINLFPLKPISIDVFQINMGKMCNQVCAHCHVDAGPDRKEIMTKETLQDCLIAIKKSGIKTIDLTGGAPEMNPHFRWFIEEAFKLDCHIMVRCNLTIIVANKKYHNLPDFYKKYKVEVVSSLPFYNAKKRIAKEDMECLKKV